MEKYVSELMAGVKAKNPGELEFHQAVQEVAESLTLVLDREPRYRKAKILERIIEPERVSTHWLWATPRHLRKEAPQLSRRVVDESRSIS